MGIIADRIKEQARLRQSGGVSMETEILMEIARIAHEVNRAYCTAIGDDSHEPWELAPDWQRRSAASGVANLIVDPHAGPQESHEMWLEEKVRDGWVYGEVKDAEAKTHPCMVAYSELPPEQRAKDYIFHAIVRTLLGQA